jgi:tetratricopeptide (TPR) repeat protein
MRMFGLSHLFYPWGIVLQIVALVHFVKRRPEAYWFYIILFGGLIGASAYLLVEVAPDARLLGGVFQGFGRRSRMQKLETEILDNPSAGNYEELGELNLEEKRYQAAREAFTKAIDAYGTRRASRSPNDTLHAYYGRAKSALGLGDYAAAIPDLERVASADVKFDYYRAAGLLGDAYARTADMERAAQWFAPATQYSMTPETLYNYAWCSKAQGNTQEARDWIEKLMAKKRTLPGYMQRVERPWFRKGKALKKELEEKK